MNNQEKWDIRFLEVAKLISTWSKDPSTQVACVIVDEENRIISTGYNGFPRGVEDTKERYNDREKKYSMIIHSEINAIIFAQRSLKNCTIYTYPMPPCARCTGAIIQSGIKRIVSITPTDDHRERWQTEFDLSQQMCRESKIQMHYYHINRIK